MANRHGDFVWYELMTTDAEASRAFYETAIGWHIDAKPVGEMDYRMIAASDGLVGGVLQLDPAMTAGGARPAWVGYIGVDDVDKAFAEAQRDGGAVLMPVMDMPNVGRMAMITDPQGAPFYVMRGASDDTSSAFSGTTPGHVSWNEYHPNRQADAMEFYGRHFGWTKSGVMPMGPMGDYWFLHQGDTAIGAIMPDLPDVRPHWKFVLRVDDIDAAADRVKAAGGQVTHGPHQVPGGDHVISALDPIGVEFGLVGGRK